MSEVNTTETIKAGKITARELVLIGAVESVIEWLEQNCSYMGDLQHLGAAEVSLEQAQKLKAVLAELGVGHGSDAKQVRAA
jgi:hypothetical protein